MGLCGGRPLRSGSIAHSATDSRRHRKGQKVAIQILDRRTVFAAPRGGIAEQLPRSGDLAQPCSPPWIGQREVQQLERPLERPGRQTLVTVTSAAHPSHFATDIGELRRQRELPPSPRRKLRVPARRIRHRSTSLTTTSSICRRTAASSMPRDRLPRLGRTLIMESNSMKSGRGRSG